MIDNREDFDGDFMSWSKRRREKENQDTGEKASVIGNESIEVEYADGNEEPEEQKENYGEEEKENYENNNGDAGNENDEGKETEEEGSGGENIEGQSIGFATDSDTEEGVQSVSFAGFGEEITDEEEENIPDRRAGARESGYDAEDDDMIDNGFNQEQVDYSEMGITVKGGDDDETMADKVIEGNLKASPKVKHSELREKNRPPRLKKSLLAAIILGSIFIFIIMVNIIAGGSGKKRDAEQMAYENARREELRNRERIEMQGITQGRNRVVNEDGDAVEFDYETGRFVDAPDYSDDLFRRRSERGQETPGTNNTERVPVIVDPAIEDRIQQARESGIEKSGGFGRNSQENLAESIVMGTVEMQLANMGIQPSGNSEVDRLRLQSEQRRAELNSQVSELTRLAQQQAQGGTGGGGRSYEQTNNQRFSNAGAYNANNTSAGNIGQIFEDDVLFPGTIIHAVLVSRIDTDYPGPIHARVTENVYDSKTGRNLLIPQGTILQGNYSSSSIGVSKVQIAWESMVVSYRGSAYQVSLGGMAGVDKRGRAGISGWLDDHYFEWLKAAGIITLFTMLNEEIGYQARQNRMSNLQGAIDRNTELAGTLSERIIDRALDIQPTVKVANGKAISVSVNAPLRLTPFPAIQAEERYVRR